MACEQVALKRYVFCRALVAPGANVVLAFGAIPVRAWNSGVGGATEVVGGVAAVAHQGFCLTRAHGLVAGGARGILQQQLAWTGQGRCRGFLCKKPTVGLAIQVRVSLKGVKRREQQLGIVTWGRGTQGSFVAAGYLRTCGVHEGG